MKMTLPRSIFLAGIAGLVLVAGVASSHQKCGITDPKFMQLTAEFFKLFLTFDLTMLPSRICSETGPGALDRISAYIDDCPRMKPIGLRENKYMYQSPSLRHVASEGLHFFCAFREGKCSSELMACTVHLYDQTGAEMADKMLLVMQLSIVPSSRRHELLPDLLKQICGTAKKTAQCVWKAMESCPSLLENEHLNQLLDSTVLQEGAEHAYKMCEMQKVSTGQDVCIKQVLASEVFVHCLDSRSTKPTFETCRTFDLTRTCIGTFVGGQCGIDAANFVTAGAHLVFDDIPVSCPIKYVKINL